MSDPIASCCLTAQTCALCPELPPATVSCWQLLRHCRTLRGGPCPEPEPSPGLRLWGNAATNCWACHPSREATKHFNGHLPNTVASICRSIHASLPLEIHLLLKWIFPASLFSQITYMFTIVYGMAICFPFPEVFHFSGSHMYFVQSENNAYPYGFIIIIRIIIIAIITVVGQVIFTNFDKKLQQGSCFSTHLCFAWRKNLYLIFIISLYSRYNFRVFYFSSYFFSWDENSAKSAYMSCVSVFEGSSGPGTLRKQRKSCSLGLF